MADGKQDRLDPTSLLPEEPMVYEIKKKKKKKKRKNEQDPFKDIDVTIKEPVEISTELDPEVTIKVENIEVELDFNDFADTAGLLVEGPHSEESQEQVVNLDEQNNHDAVILTFENVVSNNTVLGYKIDDEENSDDLHTCNECHLVFKSVRTLHIHQRNKHQAHMNKFIYICDDCGLSYEKKNSLIAHTKRKHSKNSVPDDKEEKICDICSLVFKGTMRLRMHMQRKHNSFVDAFKHECFECGLTYDKYRSLLVHIKRKHSQRKQTKKQWLNCPLCPKIFSNRDTYVRHVQRKHHQNEKIPQGILDSMAPADSESGEIPCKECPLVFSNAMYLKLHMRRKHNAFMDDFRLKCRICHLSYDKIESLKRHVRRKHGGNSTVCDICYKHFESEQALANHSHDKTVIECMVCGLIFASQGGLQKHLRCTHKMEFGPKTVFCHICKEGFYENRQLKSHLMKVHLKVSYPCKFCMKAFKTKESFRRHTLKFHSINYPTQIAELKCALCPKLAFTNEFELCKHIDFTHSKPEIKKESLQDGIKEDDDEKVDDKRPYKCTKCPESCITFEELRKHYESNHLVQNETPCQSCGEFILESELSKHMKLVHPKITVMKCPYCEFETTSKVSLTQHTLRHQNATSLNCEYYGCKYKSYFQDAMDKHKKKHQELGVKHQCAHCPFQTMNKYILRYHEEVHITGKKRYMCDQCDYATILPANLVQHKYKHSTVKRFKCEYCPFATKYNTSLRFHVRKKHCDLPFLKSN